MSCPHPVSVEMLFNVRSKDPGNRGYGMAALFFAAPSFCLSPCRVSCSRSPPGCNDFWSLRCSTPPSPAHLISYLCVLGLKLWLIITQRSVRVIRQALGTGLSYLQTCYSLCDAMAGVIHIVPGLSSVDACRLFLLLALTPFFKIMTFFFLNQ